MIAVNRQRITFPFELYLVVDTEMSKWRFQPHLQEIALLLYNNQHIYCTGKTPYLNLSLERDVQLSKAKRQHVFENRVDFFSLRSGFGIAVCFYCCQHYLLFPL